LIQVTGEHVGNTTAKTEYKNCRYKIGKATEDTFTALHVRGYVVLG